MSPQLAILVSADNAAVTAALDEILSFHGYRIIAADSVQEVERALRCPGATPIYLVISDPHLTGDLDGCEGYALYQRWTHTYPGLPFILMSA